MGLCRYVDLCFHVSSLPCLQTFWHAIPTSFCIFNVYFLLYIYMYIWCAEHIPHFMKIEIRLEISISMCNLWQWKHWSDRLLGSQVLSGEPRPNIPYTKWGGLLNHLSSLVLWHSAALVTTRSQTLGPVNWLEHCKWTIPFMSLSESSNSCPSYTS